MKMLYFLPYLFIIQACSDSQFEKRLANSFDSPLNSEVSSKKNDKTTPNSLTSEPKNKNPTLINSSKAQPKKQVKSSIRKTKNFTPQPYRIIIRLSGANPSAPAETVTTVLRDAGVVFEVEKIELLDGKSLLKNSFNR